jgi:hypothetical protein
MALPNHRICFSSSDWGRMEDVFADDILFAHQPTHEPIMIDEPTDDETFVQSFSRTQSLTSTLDLKLIADDTLDELFVDRDSHPELTQNILNEVN